MMNINVVFSVDDGYAQHLAVALASLLHNCNSSHSLKVFVLDGGISDANKNRLISLNNIRPFEIEFTTLSSDAFKDAPIQKSHTVGGKVFKSFTASAYNRLLIAETYPHIDKMIYLDADLVLADDIAGLWQEDCAGVPLCAVETPIWPERFEAQLNRLTLSRERPYFNSGVMLLNLEEIRKLLPVSRSLEILAQYGKHFICHDQDVLNIAFQGQWRVIGPKYNVLPQMVPGQDHEGFHCYSDRTIAEAAAFPVVVHFARRPKPWHFGCIDPRRALYFRYLKMTPYSDYKMPSPSMKERITFYKKASKQLLKEKAPFLYRALKKANGGVAPSQPQQNG